MVERIAPDPTRRSIVLGAGAFTALTGAGCCSVPASTIAGACRPPPTPFLAGPEVLAAWSGRERYFDAHGHFFNASDVPVKNFLAKSVAHSIDSKVAREVLVALAPIAEALADTFAVKPGAEMQVLCSGGGARAEALQADSGTLDEDIERRKVEVGKALHDEIVRRGSPIPGIVNPILERSPRERAAAARGGPSAFDREFVVSAVRDGSSEREPGGKLRLLQMRELSSEDLDAARIRNVFQFVGFMLSPRYHNLRTYIQRQAEHSPGLPLSGCFSAMVDFNYWLDSPDKASTVRDQVMVQEQLSLLSRGFLLPVVAYNPWVDIKHPHVALDTVEWAIQEHGCVGVKIYPPMGFYPYGNSYLQIEDPEARPVPPGDLDKYLGPLYETCERLGVPVMAHANESNGRNRIEDTLAGVAGWRALDKDLTSVRSLSANAGHFGGDRAPAHGDWTEAFADLMRDAKRLVLYADLGYWDNLLTDAAVQTKLRKVLARPLPDGATVADRTLYGSDWLMLSQVPGWEGYAGRVADIVRAFDSTGALARKVLGANVLKCYGLDPAESRAAFARLMRHFANNGQRLGPGWVPMAP